MSKLYSFLGILLFQHSFTFAQTRRIFGKIPNAKEKYPLSRLIITGA